MIVPRPTSRTTESLRSCGSTRRTAPLRASRQTASVTHLLGQLARPSHARLPLKHVIDLMLRGRRRRVLGRGRKSETRTRMEDLERNQVAGRQDPDSRRRQSRQQCRRASGARRRSHPSLRESRRPRERHSRYRLRDGYARPSPDCVGEAESAQRRRGTGEQGTVGSAVTTRALSCLAITACVFTAAACSSQVANQAERTTGVTVFEGARLITGDGSAPIENSAFIVQNNLFTGVGRQGELQVPAGAARVDLTGKTVMPAKVDVHGHLGLRERCGGNDVEGELHARESHRPPGAFRLHGVQRRRQHRRSRGARNLARRSSQRLSVAAGPSDAEDRSLAVGRRAVANAERSHSQRGAVSHGGPGDVVAWGGGGRPPVQK